KACVLPENPASYRVVRTKSYLFNKAGQRLKEFTMSGAYAPFFFLSHLIYIPIDYLRQLTNTLFPW
ncbi:hypothetical protein EXX54_17865, partial [Escherichia coli]|uniref:hypothetical protein n=1 Tax=Escherichia coli TaxID=562 RepID=UPI0010D1B137